MVAVRRVGTSRWLLCDVLAPRHGCFATCRDIMMVVVLRTCITALYVARHRQLLPLAARLAMKAATVGQRGCCRLLSRVVTFAEGTVTSPAAAAQPAAVTRHSIGVKLLHSQ